MTDAQHVYTKQQVTDCVLKGLERVGLRPIVEMWSKWGSLIEDLVDCNLLCPKPSDTIIDQVMDHKSAKDTSNRTADVALVEDI